MLGHVLTMLTANPRLQLTIEAHTDSIGQPAHNQALSADRAGAVRTWLVAHGVDATRLTSTGLGDSKPIASDATEDGRTQNRRVELLRR